MSEIFRMRDGGTWFGRLQREAYHCPTEDYPEPLFVLIDPGGHTHKNIPNGGGIPREDSTLIPITLSWYDYDEDEEADEDFDKERYLETETHFHCKECFGEPRLKFIGTEEQRREYFRTRYMVNGVEVAEDEFRKQMKEEEVLAKAVERAARAEKKKARKRR